MTKAMSVRSWAASGLVLGLAALAAAAQTAVTPEARWNAVAACANRDEARTRHACVDQVLNQAGLLSAEDATRPEVAPREMPARLEVQVAATTTGTDGMVAFTTTDGAVWRQAESGTVRYPPVVGQAMEIRKAALGSFLCAFPGKLAYRCRRSR